MSAENIEVMLAGDQLTAAVSVLGAELQSVSTADGVQWLWQGDPAHWAGRAPLLFPVIGRSPGDQVIVGERSYPMPGHGIARTSRFDLTHQDAHQCEMRLSSSAATLEHYPFDFDFTISWIIRGRTLTAQVVVVNLDVKPMPMAFGFHPAFPWPLPGCRGDEPHVCRLSAPANPALRRLDSEGLLQPQELSSPFVGNSLALRPSLFEEGALIFPGGIGSGLVFGVPGKPGVGVRQEGLPQLGIWTKPGAPFVCIEPWRGLPCDAHDPKPLDRRRNVSILPPSSEIRMSMSLDFGLIV